MKKPDPNCPYCDGDGVTGGVDFRKCDCMQESFLERSSDYDYLSRKNENLIKEIRKIIERPDYTNPELMVRRLKEILE